MASIPAYSGKEVKSVLTKKGFAESKGDHFHLFLEIDGKRTPIKTKVSHGRKVYTEGLFDCLKKQLKMTKDELASFLGCTLSYQDYLGLLRSKGIIR